MMCYLCISTKLSNWVLGRALVLIVQVINMIYLLKEKRDVPYHGEAKVYDMIVGTKASIIPMRPNV